MGSVSEIGLPIALQIILSTEETDFFKKYYIHSSWDSEILISSEKSFRWFALQKHAIQKSALSDKTPDI